MSRPFQLRLLPAVVEAMVQHARAELPNECCGLLAGQLDARLATATHCLRLVNAAASPTEFLSDADSMFAAVRYMRQEQLELLAVYHSHPTSAPIPSRRDLERSYGEGVVNLIIGCATNPFEIRAWWLDADRYEEAIWEVLTEESS